MTPPPFQSPHAKANVAGTSPKTSATPSVNAAPSTELSIWWIGSTDSSLHREFVRWIESPESPRRPESTWKLTIADEATPSLPRVFGHATDRHGSIIGIVIWTVPKNGISDLLKRIANVCRTKPGYRHITAGLVSPAEQRLLTEVGVTAHVQHAGEWPRCAAVLTCQK
ncbi:hypothetical protein [Rhodopirellula sp. SWK7]|uniref:hypothetical protein n=1 Tax=Rhodopirellula sp. SWK7 TaxID=595460 RepID=UPI0002BE768F|nr:hypothetical protein [Rhodopirellula sp. SWK7]EMI43881.1 hypothetical protein RRSWK_03731 [Rhodopirellula sp. SWK7]